MGIKNQIGAGFEFPVVASPNEFFGIFININSFELDFSGSEVVDFDEFVVAVKLVDPQLGIVLRSGAYSIIACNLCLKTIFVFCNYPEYHLFAGVLSRNFTGKCSALCRTGHNYCLFGICANLIFQISGYSTPDIGDGYGDCYFIGVHCGLGRIIERGNNTFALIEIVFYAGIKSKSSQ